MKFQFTDFAAFMSMQGHGPYVWAAYGITFIAIVYLVIAPIMEARAFFKQQQKLQKLAKQRSGD